MKVISCAEPAVPEPVEGSKHQALFEGGQRLARIGLAGEVLLAQRCPEPVEGLRERFRFRSALLEALFVDSFAGMLVSFRRNLEV